jgi:hypothetical protein
LGLVHLVIHQPLALRDAYDGHFGE